MFTAARDERDRRTASPDTYAEMTAYLREAAGFARAGWCGGAECEASVKAKSAATIRCLPLDQSPAASDRCIRCGRPAAACLLPGAFNPTRGLAGTACNIAASIQAAS